jgi:hypothetical protein
MAWDTSSGPNDLDWGWVENFRAGWGMAVVPNRTCGAACLRHRDDERVTEPGRLDDA